MLLKEIIAEKFPELRKELDGQVHESEEQLITSMQKDVLQDTLY